MAKQIPLLPAVRFLMALLAEMLFLAAFNRYDDWTLDPMPLKSVTAALLCGIAYLIAVPPFALLDNLRSQAGIFWGVAGLLRLIAFPLAPSADVCRYPLAAHVHAPCFPLTLHPS